MMRILFLNIAQIDVEEITKYLENQKPNLGDEFNEEVQNVLEQLKGFLGPMQR